jgi:tetratricopeptide (TPR) repeat protein
VTRGDALRALGLFALALAVYAGSLDHEFVFDDKVVVQLGASEARRESLWKALGRSYWGSEHHDPLYRPVTTTSYLLNDRLGSEGPRAYRAVNLALHAACCVALLALGQTLFGDRRLAVAASALFAVHGLHVEPVVWVVGRAELLAALFGLAAVWLHARDLRRGARRPGWRYAAALALLALSALSKESGLAFAGVAALGDVWSRRFSPAAPAREAAAAPGLALRWAGLAAVAACVLALRVRVLGALLRDPAAIPLIDNPLAAASAPERVWTPLVLLARAVRLLLWPRPLSYDYSYDAIPLCDGPLDPRAWWGLACLLGMGLAAAVSARRRGHALWCVGFFALTWALVSNTFVRSGTIFAERLLYVPSAAFCWLVASLAVASADRISAVSRRPRLGAWIAAPLFAGLCLAHAALAVARARDWRSELSLVESALPVVEASTRVQAQAGVRYLEQGQLGPAVLHLERAVEIWSDNTPAHFQLGRAYLLSGRPDRAIPHLEQARRGFPRELAALASYFLGLAERARGDPERAARWLEDAARQQPDSPQLLEAWADALLAAGDREGGARVLRRALRFAPPGHPLAARLRERLEALAR